MRTNTIAFPVMAIMLMAMTSCKKQTTPQALAIQVPKAYSDQYYADLRAYKKTNHAVAFGWLADYGDSNASISASLGERFAGVPDSMDIISLWGGFPTDQKEMRFMQKVKGTRLLEVVIVGIHGHSIDHQGILDYAQELKRGVYDNDLDGLDLDYEPDSFYSNPDNFTTLVLALSQFLGPKSGTGKILDIDYYGNSIPPVLGPYIDYAIQQNYYASDSSSLQAAYDNISSFMPPEKYIVTEEDFTALPGMGAWNPHQGRKGGFGAFYFQRDYYNTPDYMNMRKAIQICNPAGHR